MTEEHKRRISFAKLGKPIKKSPKSVPMTDEHKYKISLATRDENNPRWKGNEVGYQALHSWVANKLGRPCVCDFCGFIDSSRPRYFNWANKNHKYKRNLDDWLRLCRPCHALHDVKFRKPFKEGTIKRDKNGRFA